MDIRDWPMNRIMQLPDCCFGRRFIVSCSMVGLAETTAWDISELAFPERAVIWQFHVFGVGGFGQFGTFRVALGDQLPMSAAMMDALEPLIMGLGLQGPDPRQVEYQSMVRVDFCKMRTPILSGGRRLVLERTNGIGQLVGISLGVVVSSIPTEVPDCLVSR